AWDSLAVSGPEGAWQGFGAPLVTVRDVGLPQAHRTRAALALASGTADFDDNALAVERGDSTRFLAVDVASGTRGAAGDVASGGRHVWDARAVTTIGAARWEGAISGRGAAATLESGEVEDGRAQSGMARLTLTTAPAQWTVGFARALDVHTSSGGPLIDSRRDAHENVYEAGVRHADVAARFEWRDAAVIRQGGDLFEARTHAWWGALSAGGRLAGGRLAATVGGGRHDVAGGVQLAPGLAWSAGRAGAHWELQGTRLLVPVWTDLAPGQAQFLQRTWAGRAAVSLARGRLALDADVTGGSAEHRAQLVAAPLEEQWLRAGTREDPQRYDFVLAHAQLRVESPIWRAGVEPFVLGDDRRAPEADPRAGARAWLDWGFHAFQRDLGVRVRVDGAAVGRRTATTGDLLPGYATVGGAVLLTLEDATFAIRGFNLENAVRQEPWEETATGGLAPMPRRQVRFTLTWRLYN
ncbi:MAG TPA: hypothetical protein VFK69_00505, partial [Candidatus Eisenbacteria bacterium]|nr:hypothetical protein [Candidatus Eisenbacteria bacterium]